MFIYRINLRKHAKVHKGENGQEIENNGQQENNPELPEEVNEKSHKCNSCNKSFPSELVMKAHIKIVHEGCKEYT